jgi:peptide/nickel transport system permease protein
MSESEAIAVPAQSAPTEAGRGPWATAMKRLRRDHAAMVALALLCLIVLACLLAPVYATHIARADPFQSNVGGEVTIDGQTVPVLQPETGGLGLGVTPLGPTWRRAYFLGADNQGRDIAARLLYGGRNSLFIATGATLICLVLSTLVGIVAGFFGGIVDTVLARLLDLLWAFPFLLFAISLSIVLISQGITIGPVTIGSDSLLLPMLILGVVNVPYVARPIRGQVLSLKQSDFVLAAVALGVPNRRILLRDLLPNVSATLIVFAPLMLALNVMAEAALSFLSSGVQPPAASWGTIIQDGQNLIYTRPMVALAPGLAIVFTVIALNVFGDGLRDALDPRAKIRLRAG